MQSKEHKNAKARARNARRKVLLAKLLLQAQLAFESNGDRGLDGMLNTLLELEDKPMNDERRAALISILHQSSYVSEEGYGVAIDWNQSIDRNMIFVNGAVDVRDLSKYVVWSERVPATVES